MKEREGEKFQNLHKTWKYR